MNHRDYRNFGAFMSAMVLLMAPADGIGGAGTIRDRKAGDKAETEIDPYARPDVDWTRFNRTMAERLDTAGYASSHVKTLMTSLLDSLETLNSGDGVGYAEAIPEELRDNPLAALFGTLYAHDIKVVPHDPDVPATFRAIADALDAAWMDTTGKPGQAQTNATFRG